MVTVTLSEGMDEGVAVDPGLPQNAGEGADGQVTPVQWLWFCEAPGGCLLTHFFKPQTLQGRSERLLNRIEHRFGIEARVAVFQVGLHSLINELPIGIAEFRGALLGSDRVPQGLDQFRRSARGRVSRSFTTGHAGSNGAGTFQP